MKKEKNKKGRIGSSFDDFLREEGILEEVEARAIKRVFAWQLEQARKQSRLSKEAMARRMRTSPAAVYRLLDPENPSATLNQMSRAAAVLGKHLEIGLRDA